MGWVTCQCAPTVWMPMLDADVSVRSAGVPLTLAFPGRRSDYMHGVRAWPRHMILGRGAHMRVICARAEVYIASASPGRNTCEDYNSAKPPCIART